ncbi:MAG: hypothetical protein ACRCX2_13320 [Paraclostridium sp.]
MKQKCEEIIIDQYLKGNITDKEKTRQLQALWLLKEESEVVKSLYTELTENPDKFLAQHRENEALINNKVKQFADDFDLNHLSEDDQKIAFVKKVLIPMFMEELEDELSE